VTGFRPGDDPEQARWAGSIAGEFCTVSGIVGVGFPRYLRLFHPAYLDGPDGAQAGRGASTVSWASVARFNERVFHPLAVWPGIAPFAQDEYNAGQLGLYDTPPVHGSTPPEVLEPLTGVLAGMPHPPRELWFGYWEGMGYDGDQIAEAGTSFDLLPERTSYLLYRGGLDCLTTSVVRDSGYGTHQSVHMCWPADHAWVLGVDVDLNTSYLGCGHGLFDAVQACPDIESAEVGGEALVSYDQDRINAVVNPYNRMLTRDESG